MKKISIGFIILLVIYIANVCIANDKIYPIDKIELDCIAKTTGNTNEMNKCSMDTQTAWENEIKKSLDELKGILDSEDYKILLESQKTWENYKQKNFEFTDLTPKYKEGTMFLNAKQGFRTGLIKQRALNLKEYINTLNF